MAVGDNSPLGKLFTKELESPRRNGQYDQNSFGRIITLCNEMINQAGVIFAQFLHQFISSLPLSRCKNGKFLLRSTKVPLVCPSSSNLNHKNYFLVLLTTIYERKKTQETHSWMKGRLSYIGYIGQLQYSLLHSLIRNSNIIRDVASRNFYLAFLSRSTVEGGFATRCGEISWSVVSAKRTTFQAEAPLSNQH